jgi:hypothetical protein
LEGRRPRSKWEDGAWRDAADLLLITELEGGSKRQGMLQEEGWGGHGQEPGRRATEEAVQPVVKVSVHLELYDSVLVLQVDTHYSG